MTDHYFENDFIKLHYYRFGSGPKHMLCFHGFGMHGKQFKLLEEKLGHKYTFWGFDLPFHKQTVLKDLSLPTIKKGFTKKQLTDVIRAFCSYENITSFSVIGYSMGTHFATILVEEMPETIREYIVAAPSSLNPGALIRFFGKNRIGNKILEKLILNGRTTLTLLSILRKLRFIDDEVRDILYSEVATPELRFSLYGCFTALRNLETDENKLIQSLKDYSIKSIFIFGKRDQNYLPKIGNAFFKKYTPSEVVILDTSHEMINKHFASRLTELLE